ncbi:MAG: hypothetical protein D3923_14315, partial [Candidatus Electrothrix sp. AR3]|nr:hypothetical protein [Candidatus Electrothrix sp. AR3]
EGAGKEGKKPTKPKKQKQLIENDNIKRAKLPVLPETWNYHRLGEYIQNIQSGKSFKCDEREPNVNEVGVAKVSAVTWGVYNEAESKTCMDPEKINPDYFIKESDFLFSRANTIELIGACVFVKKVTKSIMLSDKTLRIDFVRGENKEYMLQYLKSWTGRLEITSRSTGNQDSMRNIGQERIKSIYIPACSEKEMGMIVRLLDEHLTNIDEQQHIIDDTLQKSEVLRQSILKKAFSGQLVPQDPNDEPASLLLERIAAEKAATKKAKTTRKKAHAK